MPLIEDLERLAALRQDGVLTDEEFTEAKRKLIGGTTPPVVSQPVPQTGAGQPVLVPPSAPSAAAPPVLENNTEAVVGFVTGLLSVFLYFLGIVPIVAAVFGLIALGTFDEKRHKNYWMAVTGLALGVVYCIVSLSYYGHLK